MRLLPDLIIFSLFPGYSVKVTVRDEQEDDKEDDKEGCQPAGDINAPRTISFKKGHAPLFDGRYSPPHAPRTTREAPVCWHLS